MAISVTTAKYQTFSALKDPSFLFSHAKLHRHEIPMGNGALNTRNINRKPYMIY